MKKSDGNVILASFVFIVCIVTLGIFGTDTAYIALSRFKLQKATENIALEYASSVGSKIGNSEQLDAACKKMQKEKSIIFNQEAFGLAGFNIDSMEYRYNDTEKEAYVVVRTSANVYPAFLRFIFVRGIKVYSIVCAKSEKIEMERIIEPEVSVGITNSVKFGPDFVDLTNNNKFTDVITAKNTEGSDFTINFKYNNEGGFETLSDKGGYFVFAGYKNDDFLADIGSKALIENDKKVPVNVGDKNFTCINASDKDEVKFNLYENDNILPVRRIDRIYVVKSKGAAQSLDGTVTNPCDELVCEPEATNCEEYKQREAEVKLTILNSTHIISWDEYRGAFFDNSGVCNR